MKGVAEYLRNKEKGYEYQDKRIRISACLGNLIDYNSRLSSEIRYRVPVSQCDQPIPLPLCRSALRGEANSAIDDRVRSLRDV